jgi:hypothetical protein
MLFSCPAGSVLSSVLASSWTGWGELTPRARGDVASLVQDALLVGRDELHATPEPVTLAILVADGAGVADVVEDVDAVLAPVDWGLVSGSHRYVSRQRGNSLALAWPSDTMAMVAMTEESCILS